MYVCTYKSLSKTVHGKIHIPFIVKRQAQENTVNFTYLCEEFSTRTHSEIQINL